MLSWPGWSKRSKATTGPSTLRLCRPINWPTTNSRKRPRTGIKGGQRQGVPAPQLVPAENAPAGVKQAFQDKIRNMVRALYIANAITGMFSPVLVWGRDVQNFGFPAKLNTAITKAGSVALGMQQFLIDNPDAAPFIVAQSYVPAGTGASGTPSGYSLSSSAPAMDWLNQNEAGWPSTARPSCGSCRN